MSYKIFWKENKVYVTYSNTVTLSEIREVDNSLYEDMRFSNIRYQIIDSRDIKGAFTEEDINLIAGYEIGATYLKKKMKVAFIVNNSYIKNLINLYIQKLKDTNWIFMIFETLQDAEEWCRE